MKYFLSACFSLVFLFSCDEDGRELPSPSQKSSTFLQFNESFKEFLAAESAKKFSNINSGLNFGGSEQGCGMASSITIDNSPQTLSSNDCYYYMNEEDNFEGFSIGASTIINQNLRLYIYVHFANMGIPQTGAYNGNLICQDDYDYCYYSVFLGAYFVDLQNEIDQYYYTDEAVIDVVNRNSVVTASFEEIFYYYDGNELTPAFNASGILSCCN